MDIATGINLYASLVATIDIVKDLCPFYLKKKAEMEVYIEIFKKQLSESLNEIPEENKQEPKNSIIWPAFETSIFYLEEQEYRKMFTNLITSACDNRKNNEMHTCFLEIIKQMDPLDARIIKTFKKDNQQPIVEFRYELKDTGYSTYLTNSFLINPKDDIAVNSSSITNLKRLGLVNVEYGIYFTNDNYYRIFENHPQYKKIKDSVKKKYLATNSGPYDFKYEKGLVNLTPLGEDFVKVCIE